jgi:hypothetical protein
VDMCSQVPTRYRYLFRLLVRLDIAPAFLDASFDRPHSVYL